MPQSSCDLYCEGRSCQRELVANEGNVLPVSWTEETLSVDGTPRTWLLVEPAGAAKLAPAVVFLHGLDDPTISNQSRSQYRFIAAKALSLGFIAAFPRGSIGALPGQPGSLGWGPAAEEVNARFIHQLADVLVRDYHADPTRLILAGFSNGAFFAAKELLRETPFTAFFLSAGGEPPGGEPIICPITTRRPRVYVEIGLEDAYQLAPVHCLLEHLRSSGWVEGETLRSVEHPGGHMFYAGDFDDVWTFLTRRQRGSSPR